MGPIWKNIQIKWYSIALILVALLAALSQTPEVDTFIVELDPLANSLASQIFYSFLRMLGAFVFALVFALTFGVLAATSTTRAKVILPVVDILQSVPLLGFFPTAIFWFMKLGSAKVGLEMAVVFLIFTSQAWNLVFAVYDGIKNIPESTKQAVESMALGPVAKFRRLYLPAAFPRIVDNAALSWANGWYFLMACEIIALGPLNYEVPGLGSVMFRAVENSDWLTFYKGLGALFAVIIAMDFFIWRPLGALASVYRFDFGAQDEENSSELSEDVLSFYRNHWICSPLHWLGQSVDWIFTKLEDSFDDKYSPEKTHTSKTWKWVDACISIVFWTGIASALVWSSLEIFEVLTTPHPMTAASLLLAIFYSSLRVLGAYVLCLSWILPLCFWLHRRQSYMRWAQSTAQILASIPATAFFPVIAVLSFRFFHTTELAVALMLVTGMQWYLLFNIIGGAQSIGSDLKDLGKALDLTRLQYFKNIFLPAIAPALVTGSITAVGGGWNALIIAEYIKIGDKLYKVFGIGAIISESTFESGDRNLVAYALFFMVFVIVTINKLFWQPLYSWAEKKFRMDD